MIFATVNITLSLYVCFAKFKLREIYADEEIDHTALRHPCLMLTNGYDLKIAICTVRETMVYGFYR